MHRHLPAYAAGHDLAAAHGMSDFLDHLEKVRRDVPVRLVHANDSMDVVGARKDRHQSIGTGHIGSAPFATLLAHPTMAEIPLIVETPGRATGARPRRRIAQVAALACAGGR